MPVTPTAFVRTHTSLRPVPFVPEVRLHLADDAFDLWERTEAESDGAAMPPPFWAFPWAGGQALARYVLDNPGTVRGRRVFDLASGSGLVAVAAALAGARAVTATDIDAFAVAALAANATANDVEVTGRLGDVLDGGVPDADTVLAGDVFYERATAARVVPFLLAAHAAGARVLVGDPGRAYLPRTGWETVAAYDVPVLTALEDTHTKRTTVRTPA